MNALVFLLLSVKSYAWTYGPPPAEVEAFVHEDSRSTSELIHACQMNFDLRLRGTARKTYLYVLASNVGDTQRRIQKVAVSFDNGIERTLAEFSEDSHRLYGPDVPILPGKSRESSFPFQDKTNFKGASKFAVAIVTQALPSGEPCLAKAIFEKSPARSHSSTYYDVGRSYYTTLGTLGFGPSLIQTGSKSNYGGGIFLDIAFHLFEEEHGGNIGFNATNLSGTPLHTFGIPAGYSFRYFFSENFHSIFDLSAGLYLVRYRDSSDETQTETRFAATQNLRFNYSFAQTKDGLSNVIRDHFISFGVHHEWAPSSTIQGYDVGGSRFYFTLGYSAGI